MNREDILKVYEEGPEAVVELVQSLFAIIARLEERIKKLEDQVNKNSRNSSKPPSTDGFKKPQPKSLREKGKHPVGGQKGHPGRTLSMTDQPDYINVQRVLTCSCGHDLKEIEVMRRERRQVWDIPPQTMEVIEHQIEVKICPICGCLNKGEFPSDVTAPVQYGTGVKSMMSYLSQFQLLPYDRIRLFFHDLFKQDISQATVIQANEVLFEQLEEVETDLAKRIQTSPVAHFDETGVRVEGNLHWLHVASTSECTHYSVQTKRGQEGMAAAGIIPSFFGIAVHDAWGPYWKYPCLHALCNAHLLRELTFIFEQEGQAWANTMSKLLLEIKKRVWVKKDSTDSLERTEIMTFVQRYNRVLEMGLAEDARLNPPQPQTVKKRGRVKQSKAKNLLDRLAVHQKEVLAFMHDWSVPFDNNLAERDVRMMKVQQKISGTFRSKQGAVTFCRIRGFISTLRKHSLSVMEGIRAAFEGDSILPPFCS
jgi:transposase